MEKFSIFKKLQEIVREDEEESFHEQQVHEYASSKVFMTKVVHLKKEYYDVDISRASKWGNPFTHIKDRRTKAQFVVETREIAIQKYREWILTQPVLLDSLHELKGKILGCWCKPQSCHGDVLVELIKHVDENNLYQGPREV